MKWIFLVAAIIAEVSGTSFLKSSDGFTRLWPSLGTVVSYGVCFYFLSLTLKEISVGIVYAIWAGAGIALIALIGWIVFKQPLDTPAVIGIFLIILGVAVLSLFSATTQ